MAISGRALLIASLWACAVVGKREARVVVTNPTESSNISPAAIQTSTSPSASTGLGSYIAAGLNGGISTGSQSSLTSSLLKTPTTALPSTITPSRSLANFTNSTRASNSSTSPQTSGLAFSGNGTAFAASCYEALWNWESASQSYFDASATTSIYVPVSYFADTQLLYVSATSLTTLCDGHPRAIGSAWQNVTQSPYSDYDNIITESSIMTPYPTAMPCSIGTSDCAALWGRMENAITAASLALQTSPDVAYEFPEPPCTTTPSNTTTVPFSITTITAPPTITPCVSEVLIFAQSAQLLYWPGLRENVTTSDYGFCAGGSVPDPIYNGSIPTIPGTPTGTGPNTFVTGTVTITSPDVAIVFYTLAEQGYFVGTGSSCGPVFTETLLTMPPESVSSQIGAQVDFNWYPFDFGNMNWICQSGNSSVFTTQYSKGVNCYQDVAAYDYFGNEQRYNSYTSMTNTAPALAEGLTIVNDYLPNVVPNNDLMSSFMASYFGPSAIFDPQGVWDPPSILYQESVAATAALPSPIQTTSPSTIAATTAPATPAQQSVTQLPATATPTTQRSGQTSESASVSQSSESEVEASTTFSFDPSSSTSPSTDSGTPGSHSSGSEITSKQGASQSSSAESSAVSAGGLSAPGSSSAVFSFDPTESKSTVSASPLSNAQNTGDDIATSPSLVIGTTAVTVQVIGTSAIVGSSVLSNGEVTTVNGQQVSQGSSALVIGTGSGATTLHETSSALQVVTYSSATLAISSTGDEVVVDGKTVTIGGAAQTVQGQIVSAGSSAVVIGTGASATTVTLDPTSSTGPTSQQFTILPTAVGVSSAGPGVIVIGGDSLTVGGSAQTQFGEIISAASGGLVVGTGTSASTISLSSTPTPEPFTGQGSTQRAPLRVFSGVTMLALIASLFG